MSQGISALWRQVMGWVQKENSNFFSFDITLVDLSNKNDSNILRSGNPTG